MRPLLFALWLVAVWLGWARFRPRAPYLTRLAVGDSVTLPVPMQGVCTHLVAFHGSCMGCERFVRGREAAWWITREEHPRDIMFPRVLVSEELYHTLKIGGIPVEIIVSGQGRVTYTGSPQQGAVPSCPNVR